MELRHLRSFEAVATELHFRRAAERLYLSQPTVSGHIAALEGFLRTPLFVRSNRGVQLTDSGRALLGHARQAIAVADEGARLAMSAGGGRSGFLDLAYGASTAYGALPAVLRELKRHAPEVRPRLVEMTTADQVSAILESRVLAGLVRLPVQHAHLSTRVIRRDPIVALVNSDHDLVGAVDVRLTDLQAETFLLPPRSAAPGFHDYLTRSFEAIGVHPRIEATPGGLQKIISLVAGGHGVSLAHASLAEWSIPNVATISLNERMTIETGVAWRTDSESRILREFLALLERRFPDPDRASLTTAPR